MKSRELGNWSEWTLLSRMALCHVVFLTAVLSCRGKGQLLVLCCVMLLLYQSSLFLGFLQKITVCWVGSQRCFGSWFSKVAFARLLHPKAPLTCSVSRQISMIQSDLACLCCFPSPCSPSSLPLPFLYSQWMAASPCQLCLLELPLVIPGRQTGVNE